MRRSRLALNDRGLTGRGSACRRIKRDFLEQERAKRDEALFQREYMCQFREMEGAVFSLESIDAAFKDFEPMKL